MAVAIPYNKICFVCDRPTKLSFDNEEHWVDALCEPAIQFGDGFSLYVNRGIILSE
ncbi:DUF6745 domain-containing protein [Argonema antarcticum]|uniref:DUF6745 domain-containing protein n=1 Tax=Argonema antarcticum TaxID=2942763 RepID=UPI0030842960